MRRPGLLLAAALPLLPLGCGPSADGGAAPSCSADAQCAAMTASCVAGTCVANVSPPSTWSFEITPPPASEAALTEKPFPTDLTQAIAAYAATSVAVTVSYAANVPQPANAQLVLSLPSAIAGRPDLTFTAPAAPGAPWQVAGVPGMLVEHLASATVLLAPLPPDDALAPPRTFSVSLAPAIVLAVGDSDGAVGGTLLEADSTPPQNPFAARAFLAGTATVVSNQAALRSDGSFSVRVPAEALATPLVVEVVSTSGADPSFASSAVSIPASGASQGLGTVLLPPYTSPNQFALAVQSGAQAPVAGATLTASTTLSGTAAAGSSGFIRGAVTGADGVASLSLLPGTASKKLSYEIAVVPPPGSSFATRCLAAELVGAGGTTSAPVTLGPAVQLPHRRALAGTVRAAGGAVVPDVVVSATPGSAPIAGCTRTRAAPGSAVTDDQGRYSLPLDPGSYRLDYDPPAGSPFARVTNPNGAVTVTESTDAAGGDVTLPTPGLVQGWINGPDGTTALAGATVRIYAPDCSTGTCVGSLLRGQTQTDADGQFRAVVAGP